MERKTEERWALTFRDKEVEKCNDTSVSTEHVITARPHTLQCHAKTHPYDERSL